MEQKTIIESNGSKWAGQDPDSIDDLLKVLSEEPLDRRFATCSKREDLVFIDTDPRSCGDNSPLYPNMPGTVLFWGNFYTVSHVFRVASNEPDVVAKLTAAIKANIKRPDFLAQPTAAEANAAREAEFQKRLAANRR